MQTIKWSLANPENIRPFECDGAYSSRMLTGDEMAGFPVVNVNHGTLKAGQNTGGGAHEQAEIYLIVSCGEGAAVWLGEDRLPAKRGDAIVIPPGVYHWIENQNCSEPFVLMTVWPRQEQNETHFARLRAWGSAVGDICEDYRQKRLRGEV